jgi:NAD(P)-dependent dehydrogenase (short-subunit alcohol dehydrogenase family)
MADYLNELFGLSGQTAVVVGATGVLGGALSEGLARAGAHVIVAGRDQRNCEARAESLRAVGGKAGACAVDATRRESIEHLLDAAVEQSGRVHILVNCAGANVGASFLDSTDDDWDRIMAVNLRSVFQSCQIFARHMAASGGGSIVNIGSVSSHLPLSRVFAYSASKAGVLNLSQNIAQEFGAKGVRVNVLCPGFFPAEQNRKVLTPERVDSIMRRTPMKRFGEPNELVGALLLLVSPKAGSFMTGTAVNVDGGFMAAWL